MTKLYSTNELAAIIEALIFAAEQPITVGEIIKTITAETYSSLDEHTLLISDEEDTLLEEAGELTGSETAIAVEKPTTASDFHLAQAAIRSKVYEALDLLQKSYNSVDRIIGRGFVLEEVAGGWTFRTHEDYGSFIRRHQQVKPQRLTRAALEALAIIAYQQPITKPQIEAVRGVDSGGVVKSLLERGLIRVVGRREEPGRPLLYGTTAGFLSLFNLKGLSDLPAMSELEELNQSLPEMPLFPEREEISIIDQFPQMVLPKDQDEELLTRVDEAMESLKHQTSATMAVLSPDNFPETDKK